MKKRRLGENGPMVAPMGLGCMSFGGVYGPTDQSESHRTLAKALDLGIEHLDVADVYGEGHAEEVLGAFLKDNPGRFTIATKAGIKRKPTRSFDNSPAHLRASLEGSLRRLGVDHIALFYVHRRDQAYQIEDVMETVVRFKEEGKIGAIGLSEISPATLRRARTVHPVAAVQNEYSLWTRLPDLGLVAACAEAGAALVAFSPLGRGMFCGAPIDPATFVASDFRNGNPRFVQPNLDHNRVYAERFAEFAAQMGQKPAALAIAWVLARAPHIIPIPGTRKPEHLADDFACTGIELQPEDMAAIEAILPAGFAHGDRYSEAQSMGTERYC